MSIPELEPFVSVTCEGERCHCGRPAVRKVGEEIPIDDPQPYRHNLTAYVCADHYAQLMGPAGARQVGVTRPSPVEVEGLVERIWQALSGHGVVTEDGAWLACSRCEFDRIVLTALTKEDGL